MIHLLKNGEVQCNKSGQMQTVEEKKFAAMRKGQCKDCLKVWRLQKKRTAILRRLSRPRGSVGSAGTTPRSTSR